MAATSSVSPAARRTLIARIDAILPQTQCEKCGQPGCRPYATAIVDGNADINQCPPGGERGIRELAGLLGRAFKPLNPANGSEKPKALAFIDESICIGCTLCIQACPVDAISGAAKQMHTVIAGECTGCELCVAPCPVDCITMESARDASGGPVFHISRDEANTARARFEFRNARLEREKQERADMLAARRSTTGVKDAPANANDERKKALIAAALARVNAQKTKQQEDSAVRSNPDTPNNQDQE